MDNTENDFLNARIEALETQNEQLKNTLKSIQLHLTNLSFADFEEAERHVAECIEMSKKSIG